MPLSPAQVRIWRNRRSFACQGPLRPRPSAARAAFLETIDVEDEEDKELWRTAVEGRRDPPSAAAARAAAAGWTGRQGEDRAGRVAAIDEPESDEDLQGPGADPLVAGNKNVAISEMLKRMSAMYSNQRTEQWRERTYRVAAVMVAKLPFAIRTPEDLDRREVKLGNKTKKLIEEFLATGGHVEKLEALQENPRLQIIRLFCAIWGVAAATAEKWYNQGFRSLDDLRLNSHMLTSPQRIGLQFFHTFQERIPRAEVYSIVKEVRLAAHRVFGHGGISVVCTGSFRRGADDCGDVDIVMTKREHGPVGDEIPRLSEELRRIGLLTHDLTDAVYGARTYFGACRLTPLGLHRRIDLKAYERREFPFALIHYTGSGHFNRSLRLFAKKLGLSLNEHGLFVAVRPPGSDKIVLGKSFACATEKDVFDVLGLEYRHPWDREIDAAWIAETDAALQQRAAAAGHPPRQRALPAEKLQAATPIDVQ